MQAAHKYARKIQKLGFDVKFRDFSIQNVVGSCGIGFSLDLDVLANKTLANYVPELLPGLNFKCKKATILAFASRKIDITGRKCNEETDDVFNCIYPALSASKK